MPPINQDRQPDWTAENINREKGATTFKQCGWCEHQGCGSFRYNCMISGTCDLLKSYDNEMEFDTPCRIVILGQKDIDDVIKSKERGIKEYENGIERLKKQIVVLKTDINIPRRNIPALPSSRNAAHFKLNEKVWVFYQDKWNSGIVAKGYRTYDGCVSYVLDNYPTSKEGPWGCGNCIPGVLLDSEFEYFKNNLGDFRIWLKQCNTKSYNGEKIDLELYYNTLKNSFKYKKCPNRFEALEINHGD